MATFCVATRLRYAWLCFPGLGAKPGSAKPGGPDRLPKTLIKGDRKTMKQYLSGKNRQAPAGPTEGIIGGRNAVREVLASGRDIDKIFVARGALEGSIVALIGAARERGIPVLEVDRRKLDTLCGQVPHQGIVACVAARSYCEVEEIFALAAERGEPPFLLVADGIEDPHNLGALIRTAECCGVHGLILPKRHAAGLTAVAAKASAGAIEHMLIARVSNLACTVEELKKRGVWFYAADMDGVPYNTCDCRGPAALVLGSEGFGISRLIREKCDFIVSVPMYGQLNSMNVSAAGAILLSEFARQRHAQ